MTTNTSFTHRKTVKEWGFTKAPDINKCLQTNFPHQYTAMFLKSLVQQNLPVCWLLSPNPRIRIFFTNSQLMNHTLRTTVHRNDMLAHPSPNIKRCHTPQKRKELRQNNALNQWFWEWPPLTYWIRNPVGRAYLSCLSFTRSSKWSWCTQKFENHCSTNQSAL